MWRPSIIILGCLLSTVVVSTTVEVDVSQDNIANTIGLSESSSSNIQVLSLRQQFQFLLENADPYYTFHSDSIFVNPTVIIITTVPADQIQKDFPWVSSLSSHISLFIITPSQLNSNEFEDIRAKLRLSSDKLEDRMIVFVPASSSGGERYIYTPSQSSELPPMEQWIADRTRVMIGVVNQTRRPIDIYWLHPSSLDQNGNPERVLNFQNIRVQLPPEWANTFIGHQFIAVDSVTKQDVGSIHTVKGYEIFLVAVDDLVCSLDECDPTDWNNVRDTPLSRIYHEGNHTDRSRIESNQKHPSMFPHFTQVGFEKRAMPENTLEVLRTFYRRNKNKVAVEKWSAGSIFVNHRVHPTFMIYLPENSYIKDVVFSEMDKVLREWSGIAELRPTAMYGIRLYARNSVLQNHVDRASTHVLSAIFNLDQQVDEHWPLEIKDHAGNTHHILMEPGEMVLYESATCVHGRPQPFHGRFFANSFVHFKPLSKTVWPYDHDSL